MQSADEKNIRDRLRHVLSTAGSHWDGRPFCQDALDEIDKLDKKCSALALLLYGLPNDVMSVWECNECKALNVDLSAKTCRFCLNSRAALDVKP
jgi:hypothetical protein